MVSSGTSQSEAIMPEFNVRKAVSQLLSSFFKGMTADQWGMLKSGNPDDTTMTMMGELLLDITAALTKAFLKSLGSTTMASKDDVKINLGDTISKGFAEALGVDVSVQCPSSKSLTTLISEEVSESVRSALSSPEGIVQRLTPPGKLNSMILHACKMCQAFIGKMKSVFLPRRRKKRTISEESDVEPEPSDAEDRRAATPSSDVVIAMKDIMYVTIIIKKQLNDITEPLLDDVPDLARHLEFTKILSDLLYTHILHGPEIIPEPVIRANLQRKVLGFLSLARWWQIFQVGDLADKMRHTIMGTKPRAKKSWAIAAPPAPVSVMKSRDDSARRARNEQNKICVEVFMERLVARIFKKAKVTWTVSNVQDIIQRLFEQTWAEVEGLDFDSSPETLENLKKTICRDLIKTWGNAMWVLVSLKGDQPALGDRIASAVKGHLMAPPRQRSCMCRFFSSMVAAMTRC